MRHVGARSVEIHLLGMRMCRVRDRSEGERGVASAVWSMGKKGVGRWRACCSDSSFVDGEGGRRMQGKIEGGRGSKRELRR